VNSLFMTIIYICGFKGVDNSVKKDLNVTSKEIREKEWNATSKNVIKNIIW